MLVAISGSQGTGKSSVLNELESRGHSVIRYKTARSILNETDSLDLETILTNPTDTCRFQLQVLERKWIHEHNEIYNPSSLCFTERTYLDLFAYTVSHLGNKNSYSTWINDYFDKCLSSHTKLHKVFLLKGGIFDIENDSTRPMNHHYGHMVDGYLSSILHSHTSNLTVIEFEGVKRRADYIEQELGI